MRLQVLDKVHGGHLGIVKCGERAKACIWRTGLSREVQDMVENCKVCAKYQQLRTEPLMPTSFPERPWQMIATDLFELDKLNYLIVVDYFSRYIEIAAMQKTTKSHEVIRALKQSSQDIESQKKQEATMAHRTLQQNSLISLKSGISSTPQAVLASHNPMVRWSVR